ARAMTERGLERFVEAQARADVGYEAAAAELRAGRKCGHWIWWVLPQVAGLGASPTSVAFAIADAWEAEAYLRHPTLGPRYAEVARILADALVRGAAIEHLLG